MPNGRPEHFLEFVEGTWNGKRRVFRDGIVVVAFIPDGQTAADIEAKIQEIVDSVPDATVDKTCADGRWVSIRVPAQTGSVVDVADELASRADVRFTQPDFLVLSTSPSVPSAGDIDLWWLDDIRAKEAWDIETGKSNVLIGIVDSGIALVEASGVVRVSHEDLDPDRFSLGPDYTGEGEDAEVYKPVDEHGHGTAVAGIIAADADDEVGVKGMNQASPVCVCRVLTVASSWADGNASGADTDLNLALRYLLAELDSRTDVDRLIINVSAVIPDATEYADVPLCTECVRELAEDGRVIVCASSGNNGSSAPRFPAGFADATLFPDAVVAVGAFMSDGSIREDSNYGNHLTVAAPGEKVWTTLPETEVTMSGGYLTYGPFDETSAACPIVAGIMSLVWSKAPGLTTAQVVECVTKSARTPSSANPERFGSGMVDAYGAVPNIEVDATPLTFVAVPAGTEAIRTIEVKVKSCVELHLRTRVSIDPGSSVDANVYEVTVVFTPVEAFDEEHTVEIPVAFRSLKVGAVVTGTVTVRCDEFGPAGDVVVRFSASTGSGDSLVALVADRSGSMGDPAGSGTSTRMDVLKAAASVMIQDLPLGSAVDIVSFSDDAANEVGPSRIPLEVPAAATVREALIKAIMSLHTGGLTSIGDGLELAQSNLSAAAGYGNDAIVVLTDGRETAAKYIDDVIGSIKSDVYAIGLGTPSVVNAAALAALSDPYLLITGDVPDEDRYKVAKYFIQILADIRSEDVVLDPAGRLRPGEEVRIPFAVTEADYRTDVIVMWPRRNIFKVKIEGPLGYEVRGDADISDVCSIHRLPMPRMDVHRNKVQAGIWYAVLEVIPDAFEAYRQALGERLGAEAAVHGAPYDLMVTTQSGLQMRCSLTQHDIVPGSDIFLRARLREHGAPLPTATVRARITEPDGTSHVVSLGRSGRDIYQKRFTANLAGLYQVRFLARGNSSAGFLFTREQIRTGFTI